MDTWAACLTEEAWAWRHDANVVSVLAHLLELAAPDTCRCGYEILACGDAMTSHTALADATDLTVKQVRLTLTKLKDAGEIEPIRRPRGLLIRVLRYQHWQGFCEREREPHGNSRKKTAGAGQTKGGLKAGKSQGEGRIKAGKGQSHIIIKGNKEGFLTTNPPLSPPPDPAAKNYDRCVMKNGKEGLSVQNQKKVSEIPDRTASGTSREENQQVPPDEKTELRPNGKDFVKRLQKFASAEKIFLSPSVLNRLCSEPLEYIGLVYEAAVEKREGKSNVMFPHAVARYRADMGVLPKKDTLARLRRVLSPQPPPLPRRTPRADCPCCRGAGTVGGEPCECIGGRHRDASEMTRIEQERNTAIRKIRQQLELVRGSS